LDAVFPRRLYLAFIQVSSARVMLVTADGRLVMTLRLVLVEGEHKLSARAAPAGPEAPLWAAALPRDRIAPAILLTHSGRVPAR
jgi:hypothetical protein